MQRKIRWGIVGLGKIAQHFANDLELVEDAVLAAVASRSGDKAKEFADKNGVPHFFAEYDTLFESSEVDVVYIATPHTFHKNIAIKAMKSGKHVLCEKPIGIHRLEVEELVKVAKENKVFLMEALWSRFNPTIKKVLELVENGTIGTLKYINADFGFYAMDRPLESRLFNLDLAGGTLLDIGIYPIFLTYLMMGKPKDIAAFSNFNEHGTEVQTSVIFQYDNQQALLHSSFTNETRMNAELAGTDGSIFLHPRWHESQGYTLKTSEGTKEVNLPTTGRGYTYEIAEVQECIKKGQMESKLWSHQDSLDLITLLDMVRNKTGVRFPFEL